MAITTSKIKVGTTTKTVYPGGSAHVGATAGWVTNNDKGALTCPVSITAGTAYIPVTGLNVGDVITAFRVLGGSAGAQAKTLDASLRKTYPHATDGSLTDASVQAMTQYATQVGKINSETILTTPERVAAQYQYYILLTVTTGNAGSFNINSVEVDIKRGWGQPV